MVEAARRHVGDAFHRLLRRARQERANDGREPGRAAEVVREALQARGGARIDDDGGAGREEDADDARADGVDASYLEGDLAFERPAIQVISCDADVGRAPTSAVSAEFFLRSPRES